MKADYTLLHPLPGEFQDLVDKLISEGKSIRFEFKKPRIQVVNSVSMYSHKPYAIKFYNVYGKIDRHQDSHGLTYLEQREWEASIHHDLMALDRVESHKIAPKAPIKRLFQTTHDTRI